MGYITFALIAAILALSLVMPKIVQTAALSAYFDPHCLIPWPFFLYTIVLVRASLSTYDNAVETIKASRIQVCPHSVLEKSSPPSRLLSPQGLKEGYRLATLSTVSRPLHTYCSEYNTYPMTILTAALQPNPTTFCHSILAKLHSIVPFHGVPILLK